MSNLVDIMATTFMVLAGAVLFVLVALAIYWIVYLIVAAIYDLINIKK